MKTRNLRSLIRSKMRAAFLCFAILFGLSIGEASGAPLTFVVGATNGVTNSQVVVPIRASNFTNISSFQFSFHWDTNVASFVDVEQFGLPGMGVTDFGIFTTGSVTVAWIEPNAGAANLADGAMVFGVRLKLTGPAAATGSVTIDGVPTALLAGDENLSVVPATNVNSILSIDRTLIVGCPSGKTVECGSVWSFDFPVVLDSCSGLPATINVMSTGTNMVSCGFIATRVWEIIDQCDNRTTCSQIVTGIDTMPPRPIPSVNKTIEYGQGWSFDEPTGTDTCSGSISVQILNTITNAGPCGPTYSVTRTWELSDGCDNKTNCSQTVTVRDSAPPSMSCFPDKNVNCLTPWFFDAPSAVDLADGLITPIIVSTITNGSCGAGFMVVRTWRATDSCGNSSTCMQRIFGRAIVTISGTVFIPSNYPPTISEKRVAGTSLKGPTNTSATAASDGSFNLVFDAANNVAVDPVSPTAGGPADGVTSLDISFIRRHILNVVPLDSPYKILAADVDGSSSVSTLDLSFIRRLVLGTTNRFPIGLWRFLPAGHLFGNVLAPWDAPTNRYYTTVGGDISGQDFVALKVGDVNNSWQPPLGLTEGHDGRKSKASENGPGESTLKTGGASAGSDPVNFTVGTTNGFPGTDVLVPIRVGAFNGVGTLQFSFHWNTNAVTFLNVDPVFGLAGMTAGGNFNLSMSNSGILAVSWDDTTGGTTTLPDGTSIFSLKFRITGAPSNTSSLIISNSPTAYEVTDGFTPLPSTAVPGLIYIDQPNRAPVLANISNQAVDEQTLLSFTPGATDADGSVQTLTYSLDSGFPTGAAINSASGLFTWTPTEAQGPNAYPITVRVTDNGSPPLSGTRTFTVTVNEVNGAPTAIAEAYNVNEDGTINQSAPGVLVNDTDPDGNSLTAVLVANPTHGTLNLNANGSFTYTPTGNYNGPDSFTYQASDGSLTSGITTVTLTVVAVNDTPVAVNDSHTTAEDTPLAITAPGVLVNDTDVDANPLSAVLVSTVTHGTLTLSANGGFNYTPSSNYAGADSFTYRATDGSLTSGVATVSITVTPVNDIPVAVNDSQYFTLEDTRLNIATTSGILTNDSDADGGTLTALLVSTTTNGVLVLTNNGGFTYLANTNFNGIDHFTYRVSDGVSTSALAIVTLTVQAVNDVPTVTGDSHVVVEDSTLTIPVPGVLGNDNDQDGDVLKALLVTGAANGTLSLSTNGSFNYTPNPNYAGVDTFTYRATDGSATSSVATVTITVTAVNDAPVAANDTFNVNEDGALNIPAPGVLSNDTDAEGTLLSAILVSGVSHGTLTLNANGSFAYTPTGNYNGTDTFTYRSTDGQATSAVATVTITINSVNDLPVALDDAYTVTEDATLTVGGSGVLANDTDSDNATLTAVLVAGPSHGTLTFSANGSFNYVPAQNFYGSDFFTYRANDGTANSAAAATVAITVTAVNDAPVLVSIGTKDVVVGNPLTFTAVATDVDEPPQSLTFSLDGAPAEASIHPVTGAFSWTPGEAEASTTNYFTIRVTDNGSPQLSTAETIAVIVYAMPTISIADTSVPGGSDGLLIAEFTVGLSSPMTRAVSVDFTTLAGSALAGEDFAATNGTVIFPPGATNVVIEVTVVGKSTVYTNRTFSVNLSNPTNGVIANAIGVGTIDANPAPGFYIDDVTVAEANGGTGAPKANAVFTVTLLGGSDRLVTVSYAALPGSALSRKDFKLRKGVLKFAPGVTTQNITVPITGETMSESNEWFTVNLSRPVNAVIIHGQGRGMILDDDQLPAVTITDVEMVEPNTGASAASFLVRLSAKSGRSVLVNYATADNTALANSDYVPTSGTLVFPPGITQQRIYVNVVGNTISENDETFSLNLGNPVNATMSNGHAFGHIRDGDKVPLVSVSDAVVDSAVTTATFTVFLSAPSGKTITVNVATSRDTAQPDIDYTPLNAALTFEPGVTEMTVSVPLLKNSSAATSRSFYLTLVGVLNTVMADRIGVCTIPPAP